MTDTPEYVTHTGVTASHTNVWVIHTLVNAPLSNVNVTYTDVCVTHTQECVTDTDVCVTHSKFRATNAGKMVCCATNTVILTSSLETPPQYPSIIPYTSMILLQVPSPLSCSPRLSKSSLFGWRILLQFYNGDLFPTRLDLSMYL